MRRRAGDRGTGLEVVPGYIELRRIGSGASSVVYEARKKGSRRQVALKILNMPGLMSGALAALQQEIASLEEVGDHPNIVTFHDSFALGDGRPVLVLQLCVDSTASPLARGEVYRVDEAVEIGIKMSSALAGAHAAGILHLDVKPENILITSYGEPALADFGLARLRTAAQSEALSGFSIQHAPRELLEGLEPTEASDVYELASTMYQLLSGRAPFVASDRESLAATVHRILHDPVPPLVAPAVPVELSDLLVEAMAKDPASRPASAESFAKDLQRIQRGCGWEITPFLAPLRPEDESARDANVATAQRREPGLPEVPRRREPLIPFEDGPPAGATAPARRSPGASSDPADPMPLPSVEPAMVAPQDPPSARPGGAALLPWPEAAGEPVTPNTPPPGSVRSGPAEEPPPDERSASGPPADVLVAWPGPEHEQASERPDHRISDAPPDPVQPPRRSSETRFGQEDLQVHHTVHLDEDGEVVPSIAEQEPVVGDDAASLAWWQQSLVVGVAAAAVLVAVIVVISLVS